MSRRLTRRRRRSGLPSSGGGHLGGSGGGSRRTGGGGQGVNGPDPEYSFGEMVVALVVFPLAFVCIPLMVAAASRLFNGGGR